MSAHLQRHFRSPFPALNVNRRSEPVATDTVYADTPGTPPIFLFGRNWRLPPSGKGLRDYFWEILLLSGFRNGALIKNIEQTVPIYGEQSVRILENFDN